MQVVIDSSVLVGLLVPNDLWHAQATALWNAVKSAGHIGLFLDCVVAEAVSTAARRLFEKKRTSDFDSISWLRRLARPADLSTGLD